MTATLAALLADVDVLEWIGDQAERTEVTAVTQDSRMVEPGALYCCIAGGTVDGHDLAADVVAAGARSLLVERVVDVAVPQARVATTRAAVAAASAAFFGHPSRRLSVVGVTGTNGKTTTANLCAAALLGAGRRTGVIGTLSGARTTPEAPLLQAGLAAFLDDGCEAVAMEVSSIALDQHRADAVDFAVAVWTNLSQDHLDYHGDMERYYAAKRALFEPSRCRLAVVNRDDPWGRRLLEELDVPAVSYGLGDAEVGAMTATGSTFRWHGEAIHLSLGGAHNIANALAAATATEALGVPARLIAAGLSAAPPVPGRWESIDAGQDFAVVVDFAHTPDGLERVLGAARDVAGSDRRVLVVFGCGGDRDATKRPKMAAVATAIADLVVLTSDNPRSEDPMAIIAEAAAGAVCRDALVVEPDRERAIELAIGSAQAGDVVVIAGKGHETGQTIGDRVIPFDDRAVARRLLTECAG